MGANSKLNQEHYICAFWDETRPGKKAPDEPKNDFELWQEHSDDDESSVAGFFSKSYGGGTDGRTLWLQLNWFLVVSCQATRATMEKTKLKKANRLNTDSQTRNSLGRMGQESSFSNIVSYCWVRRWGSIKFRLGSIWRR